MTLTVQHRAVHHNCVLSIAQREEAGSVELGEAVVVGAWLLLVLKVKQMCAQLKKCVPRTAEHKHRQTSDRRPASHPLISAPCPHHSSTSQVAPSFLSRCLLPPWSLSIPIASPSAPTPHLPPRRLLPPLLPHHASETAAEKERRTHRKLRPRPRPRPSRTHLSPQHQSQSTPPPRPTRRPLPTPPPRASSNVASVANKQRLTQHQTALPNAAKAPNQPTPNPTTNPTSPTNKRPPSHTKHHPPTTPHHPNPPPPPRAAPSAARPLRLLRLSCIRSRLVSLIRHTLVV